MEASFLLALFLLCPFSGYGAGDGDPNPASVCAFYIQYVCEEVGQKLRACGAGGWARGPVCPVRSVRRSSAAAGMMRVLLLLPSRLPSSRRPCGRGACLVRPRLFPNSRLTATAPIRLPGGRRVWRSRVQDLSCSAGVDAESWRDEGWGWRLLAGPRHY